jgi:hypothetical protein
MRPRAAAAALQRVMKRRAGEAATRGADGGRQRGAPEARGLTGEQGKDVVAAAVPGLDDEREVGRVGAVVGEARGLLVGVGRRQVVRQLARPVEHLALVVGAVLDVRVLGNRLHLSLRVADVDEVAVGDAREAVA